MWQTRQRVSADMSQDRRWRGPVPRSSGPDDAVRPRPSEVGEGDVAAALHHLQRVHGPMLLSFLTRLTHGDVHRAEDIVQETLLCAWRNPGARDADGRWSRGWLLTVAKRIFIDQLRAAESRPEERSGELIEANARTDDAIERLVDAGEVRAAVNELPERLRAAVVGIYFQERSVAEVADLLDVPPGTIRSRTFYGLRALREALGPRGFFPGPATPNNSSANR
jgi:RNA polymerase sigma-70 factor (ECF subfamily)